MTFKVSNSQTVRLRAYFWSYSYWGLSYFFVFFLNFWDSHNFFGHLLFLFCGSLSFLGPSSCLGRLHSLGHFDFWTVSLFLKPSSFLDSSSIWVVIIFGIIFILVVILIFGSVFFSAVQDLQWPSQFSPNAPQIFGLHRQTDRHTHRRTA